MAVRTGNSQIRQLYVGTDTETSVADGNAIITGSVGIGTTALGAKLHVENAGDVLNLKLTTGGYNTLTLSTVNFSGGNNYAINPYITGVSNGGFEIKDLTNNASRISIAPTSGSVGIGTTSPTDKLTVNGNLSIFGNKIYNGSASNSAGVSFPGSTTRIDGYNGITFHSSTTTVGSQSERMRIDSSGNVGIGTTSPYSPLQIGNYTGTAGFSYGKAATFVAAYDANRTTIFLGSTDATSTQDKGGSIAFGGGSEAGSTPYTFAQIKGLKEVSGGGYSGYMRFDTTPAGSYTNTERMRITSAGGISFGSTGTAYGTSGQILKSNANASPTWVDASTVIGGPYLPLSAGSGERVTGDLYISDKLYMRPSSTYGSGYKVMHVTGTGSAPYPTILHFSNYAKSSVMVINDENVGIGTTNPGAKLQVGTRGTAGALTPPTTDGILFDFHNDGPPYTRHAAIISQAGDASESVIDFWTKEASGANSKKMTLRGNGYVGIGTTSPTQKLEVNGVIESPYLEYKPFVFYDFNSDTVDQWGTSNATLSTPSKSVTRFTTTGTDANLNRNFNGSGYNSPAIPGGQNQIIRIRYKWISGTAGNGEIFYATSGHGYSGSYYKNYALNTDGEYHTLVLDMSNLNSGGTDWVDNDITAIRFDLINITPVVIDIDWIAVGGNGWGTQYFENDVAFMNGNVGIGTTDPGFALDVHGDSTAGVLSVKNAANGRDTFRSENAAGTRTVNIGNDGSGHGNILIRNSAGTTTNYISGSGNSYFNGGNVGIGVTSPIQKLDTPNIVIGGSTISASYRANALFIDNNGGTSRFYSAGANTTTKGGYVFHNMSSDATINPEVLTILPSGNVGINETSPSQKLHVAGNARVTGAYYDSGDSPGSTGEYLKSTITGTTWASIPAYKFYLLADSPGTSVSIADSTVLDIAGGTNISTVTTGVGSSGDPYVVTANLDNDIAINTVEYTYPTAIDQYRGEIVYFGTFPTGNGSNGAIGAGDVIVYTSAGLSQGWIKAQGNIPYGKGMLGIAMGTTPAAGILVKGFARNAAFTSGGLGSVLYLSPTSAGDTTVTIPNASNNIVRIVGYMLNPTNDEIFFDPDKSWVQIV